MAFIALLAAALAVTYHLYRNQSRESGPVQVPIKVVDPEYGPIRIKVQTN